MHTRAKSLADLVVQELRTRILDGRLRLGESLSENALAAELGISKTPVREALLQLKLDRLVEVLPQRGTYVFRLSADEVSMVCELREMLEVAAAEAAMRHNRQQLTDRLRNIIEDMRRAYQASDEVAYATLDGSLHETFLELCGNAYVRDAYGPIGFRVQALRTRINQEETLNRHSFRDHCEMLRLVEAGQSAALQRLLREHIRTAAQSALELVANNRLIEGERASDAGVAPTGKAHSRKAMASR